MPRKCTICSHSEREAIEQDILNGISYRIIAGRYAEISMSALGRHAKNGHMNVHFAPPAERLEGQGILAEMNRLIKEAQAIGVMAIEAKKLNIALTAIREQSRIMTNLISLAEVLEKADHHSAKNFADSNEYKELRSKLLKVLVNHPEIHSEIVDVFSDDN